MMPVMITVFSFNFPIGLVIYWIMNNVFSLGQHKVIVQIDQAKGELPQEVKTVETKTKDNNVKEENAKKKKSPAKKGTGKKSSAKKGKESNENKDKELDFFSVKPGKENELEEDKHTEDKGNDK